VISSLSREVNKFQNIHKNTKYLQRKCLIFFQKQLFSIVQKQLFSIVQKHFFGVFLHNVCFSRQLRFQSGIEAQFKRFHSQQHEGDSKEEQSFSLFLRKLFVSGGGIKSYKYF
jgi:hypothetical protein